jgi:hypothetical protein
MSGAGNLFGTREGDDLRPVVAMTLLDTFRGVVEAGVEGCPAHRADLAGLGVGDVNEAVERLELKRFLDQSAHAPTDARFALNGELIQISFNCRLNDLAPGIPCSGAERMVAPVRSPFPMET